MVEFMQHGTTITLELYCECRAGMAWNVDIQCSSPCPHRALLENLNVFKLLCPALMSKVYVVSGSKLLVSYNN
jgi:hypothetical protein